MRLVYELAVRLIAKYLTRLSANVYFPDVNRWLTTCNIFYKPDIEKVIECYVDANFSGGWDQLDTDNA